MMLNINLEIIVLDTSLCFSLCCWSNDIYCSWRGNSRKPKRWKRWYCYHGIDCWIYCYDVSWRSFRIVYFLEAFAISSKFTFSYKKYCLVMSWLPYLSNQSLWSESSIFVGAITLNSTVYNSSFLPGKEIFLA